MAQVCPARRPHQLRRQETTSEAAGPYVAGGSTGLGVHPLVIAAVAWVKSAADAIAPHNSVSSRLAKPRLPISSLPRLPVMQLEFVRGAEDGRAILQVGTDAEEKNVAAVKTGNDLDTRHLIPALRRAVGPPVAAHPQGSKSIGDLVFLAALLATAVIASADLLENSGIARILAAPADDDMTDRAAVLVSAAAFVKWTLLGLLLIYLGVVAWLGQSWRRWLMPVLFAVGLLLLAIVGRHAVERF